MTSETGVVRAITLQGVGEAFPMVNPFCNFREVQANARDRRVHTAMLTGTAAAIATDDYTFTLFVAGHAEVVDACFVVDPVGLDPDATNDNNFTLKNGATELCQQSTAYGVVANEPWEITRKNTVANRTLAKGDTVTLVIDGDTAGQIINHGTMVFVVTHLTATA